DITGALAKDGNSSALGTVLATNSLGGTIAGGVAGASIVGATSFDSFGRSGKDAQGNVSLTNAGLIQGTNTLISFGVSGLGAQSGQYAGTAVGTFALTNLASGTISGALFGVDATGAASAVSAQGTVNLTNGGLIAGTDTLGSFGIFLTGANAS